MIKNEPDDNAEASGDQHQYTCKNGQDEPISMESLAKICTTLNCGLDDIVEITTDTEK